MKINGHYETETQEFKTSLSELDKGIMSLTAMLNKSGKGKVYFGVSDDGDILGLKSSLGRETIKKIGTRISETVKPAVVPKIYFEEYGEATIIVVEVEGYNKPYSVSGEYRIRVGSENRKIDPELVTVAMKYDVQDIVAMLPGHWTYRGKLREAHRRLRQLEEERMRTGKHISASEFWSDKYKRLMDADEEEDSDYVPL